MSRRSPSDAKCSMIRLADGYCARRRSRASAPRSPRPVSAPPVGVDVVPPSPAASATTEATTRPTNQERSQRRVPQQGACSHQPLSRSRSRLALREQNLPRLLKDLLDWACEAVVISPAAWGCGPPTSHASNVTKDPPSMRARTKRTMPGNRHASVPIPAIQASSSSGSTLAKGSVNLS